MSRADAGQLAALLGTVGVLAALTTWAMLRIDAVLGWMLCALVALG